MSEGEVELKEEIGAGEGRDIIKCRPNRSEIYEFHLEVLGRILEVLGRILEVLGRKKPPLLPKYCGRLALSQG
jgi:hypothetical protein